MGSDYDMVLLDSNSHNLDKLEKKSKCEALIVGEKGLRTLPQLQASIRALSYCIETLVNTTHMVRNIDQGYGRGGTPIFTGVFEPLPRVDLYPTDEDGLGTWFGAA